jgi:hypothetical protein
MGGDIDLIIAKFELIVNSLGEKHLSWWEHKGSNQCRICDLIVIIEKLIGHIDSKSPLDYMNVQETSELESEVKDIAN